MTKKSGKHIRLIHPGRKLLDDAHCFVFGMLLYAHLVSHITLCTGR